MGILEKGAIQPAGSIEERSEQLKELLTSTECFEFVSAKNEANKSVYTYAMPYSGGRLFKLSYDLSSKEYYGTETGIYRLSDSSKKLTDFRSYSSYPVPKEKVISYTKVLEDGRGALLLDVGTSYNFSFYWGTGANGTKMMHMLGVPEIEGVSSLYDAFCVPKNNNSVWRQNLTDSQYAFYARISMDGVRTQDKLIQNMMPMEWQNPTTVIPGATSTEELVGFYSYSNQTVKIKAGEIYNDVLTNKRYYCLNAVEYSPSAACLMEIT